MRRTALISCALASAAAGQVSAGLMFGPDALTAFEDWHADLGGEFVDFEGTAAGTNLNPGADLLGAGMRFASIVSTSGSAFGPFHVEVSNRHLSGTYGNTIVGSPCGSCTDDGRVGYEIVFDEPQRRAGLMRIWNTAATTAFYDGSGSLLSMHQNTVNNEFVGYVADDEDPSTWVKRIVMDGTLLSGTRQVGYSDMIYSGLTIPAPAAVMPLVLGGAAIRRRTR